jgi:hypothetical protein
VAEIEYLTDDENVSGECLHFCAPGAPAACDKSWCECDCHRAPEEIVPENLEPTGGG